jgi:hypothetical protein
MSLTSDDANILAPATSVGRQLCAKMNLFLGALYVRPSEHLCL